MKRALAVLLACLLLCGAVAFTAGAADGVDITNKFTDPAFKAAVQEIIGKDMILDTDVAGIRELVVNGHSFHDPSFTWENLGKIKNLAGLEYFTSLRLLGCSFNQITLLPTLPSGLEALWCEGNQLTALPALPSGIKELICANNKLSALPSLPTALEALSCWENRLTMLPALPSGLNSLDCSQNSLTSLPALPSGLTWLNCNYNQLVSLPRLPSDLELLYCRRNRLISLPELPSNLRELRCSDNELTLLPTLPLGLQNFMCENNQLTGIDVTGLQLEEVLWVHNNYLSDKSAVIGFTGEWDGEYFIFDPQHGLGMPKPPPFYSTWPPALQWILEYILFGWLWMRWI